jgi:hypothetical protein
MSFTQHQKNHLLSQLQQALDAVKSMPVATPCSTCMHRMQVSERMHCLLAKKSLIPDEVLPIGCEAYKFDAESAPF